MAYWMKASGSNIPDGAVQGGKDTAGHVLYVARCAAGNEGVIPGYVAKHLNGCWVAHRKDETLEVKDYQILMLPEAVPGGEVFLEWRPVTIGQVSNRHLAFAMPGSDNIYVGRGRKGDTLWPGKIGAREQVVSYVFSEHRQEKSQLCDALLQHVELPQEYKVTEVKYDFKQAKVESSDEQVIIAEGSVEDMSGGGDAAGGGVEVRVPYNIGNRHTWSIARKLVLGTKTHVESPIITPRKSDKKAKGPEVEDGTKVETMSAGPHMHAVDSTGDSQVAVAEGVPGKKVKVVVMANKIKVKAQFTAKLHIVFTQNRIRTCDIEGGYCCELFENPTVVSGDSDIVKRISGKAES